jgi:hypothetical protein
MDRPNVTRLPPLVRTRTRRELLRSFSLQQQPTKTLYLDHFIPFLPLLLLHPVLFQEQHHPLLTLVTSKSCIGRPRQALRRFVFHPTSPSSQDFSFLLIVILPYSIGTLQTIDQLRLPLSGFLLYLGSLPRLELGF